MQIQVTGQQWFWTFKYEEGVTTSREVFIPVGQPVEFIVTSRDVIHSFWVPQLGGKIDAIPGRRTTTWFEAQEPGTYLGQCAEFCGLEHYAMLFDVHVLPESEFAAWMDEHVAMLGNVIGDTAEPPNMEELETGDTAHGEELFNTLGCSSCHTLGSDKIVGPGLAGVGQRAANRRADEGYSAEQYLAESVIQPCDYLVPDFACQMPSFGNQLTPADLADLVEFLLQQ
jgi:cytochrome c oxidase subunit 2